MIVCVIVCLIVCFIVCFIICFIVRFIVFILKYAYPINNVSNVLMRELFTYSGDI